MQHHLTQIVSSLLIIGASTVSLHALEIPVVPETTIEVPYKQFSIIKFPFKVTNIQQSIFSYTRKKSSKLSPAVKASGVKQITLTKAKGASAAKIEATSKNILNIKKIDNILTMRPSFKGETQVIVWGNSEFPMVIKIKVVDDADKNIEFIQIVSKRSEVANFESSPHEKVIERIMKSLYNSELHPKPRGYENVARKELYDVEIKDRDNSPFARLRVSLSKEYVGKKYIGQVWNVNVLPEFDTEDNTIEIPDGFKLSLYEEMFDSQGVYAVSLETYQITKGHGTRIMLVREKVE